MTKNAKYLLFSVVLAAASLLAVGGKPALAAGSVPSGTLSSVKARVNPPVSESFPLSKEARGAKTFGADTTASLVKDELGNAPTTGSLASIEIGGNTPGSVPQCYLLVYDSSVASDTTEAGSVSALLVPPLPATTSGNPVHELSFPRSFHKGLVVLVGGAGASSCRASIGWLKNGL